MRSTLRAFAIVALISPSPAAAQAPALTPPEGFVLDGMPPVPESVATAMAPYNQARYATLVAWHPTRREILVGTTFAETMQFHRVAGPGMARTQLTFFEEGLGGGQRRSANRAMFEPTSGRAFVFQRDADGKSNYQNYRFDLESASATRLTDGQSRNTLGAWSTKGDRMAYASTRRNGKDYDLYVIDPADPSSNRLLARGEGFWDVVDWSPDDRTVLAVEVKSAEESVLWRVEVATGEMVPLSPQGGSRPVSYAGAAFAGAGESVYVTTDQDSNFLRLARLDPATGRIVSLTDAIDWDVEEFALSPDQTLIAFVTNEDGAGVLHLLDVATGAERPAPKVPTGIVSNIHWHPNGVDLAFDLQSPRSAGDVYALNVKTGQVERWTFSEAVGLNPESFAEPGVIRWKSFDGRMISGILYRPPTRFAGRRPVMINVHGGPEAQARPSWIGRSNYFLNDMGVAIIYPNVRGSRGFGKEFLQLDNGILREGAIADIGALLDWIAAQPDLDPSRVMVTGASYGGFMTLAVAATYPDRIRCVFAGFGQSNLVTFLEGTDPSRQDRRRAEYGDERDPAVRAVLERIAPVNHADRVKTPLFVAHDKNDTSVPYTESEQMVAAVKPNGAPVWYLLATSQGHGLTRSSSVAYLMHAWAYFMQQYLIN